MKIECTNKTFSLEFEGSGADMITQTAIIIKNLKDKIAEDSGMPDYIVDMMLKLAMEKIE